jgi:hypothetical protein
VLLATRGKLEVAIAIRSQQAQLSGFAAAAAHQQGAAVLESPGWQQLLVAASTKQYNALCGRVQQQQSASVGLPAIAVGR